MGGVEVLDELEGHCEGLQVMEGNLVTPTAFVPVVEVIEGNKGLQRGSKVSLPRQSTPWRENGGIRGFARMDSPRG